MIWYTLKEDLVQDLLYKEDSFEESYFGCSIVTCGTQCFNMCVATSGLSQQTNWSLSIDKFYCSCGKEETLVEHDVPTCMQHLTLIQQVNIVFLERNSGRDWIWFVAIFFQCICVIYLTAIEDQINLNGYLNLNFN